MHPLMYRPSLPSQVSQSLTDRMMMQMSWYLTDCECQCEVCEHEWNRQIHGPYQILRIYENCSLTALQQVCGFPILTVSVTAPERSKIGKMRRIKVGRFFKSKVGIVMAVKGNWGHVIGFLTTGILDYFWISQLCPPTYWEDNFIFIYFIPSPWWDDLIKEY